MKAAIIVALMVFFVYVSSDDSVRLDCDTNITVNRTMVRHPCSCTTYFVCLTDPPMPMECPSGLYFNEEKQVCDYKINVRCIPKPGCRNV
ncbi:peritrophin-1 [Bombus fervidus]|uniref:peritrophin-1 n=1 Tax=Bombus fervidus TaxID=203811 RepID=UPI003D18F62A